MSYILDALRRADSERERGSVPSIHSPPAPHVADDPKPPGGNAKVLVGVIVALLLALAGLLAWHLFSGKEATRGAGDLVLAEVPQAPPAQEPAAAPQAEPPQQRAPAQAPWRQTSPPPPVQVTQPSAKQAPPASFQRQQTPVLSVPERSKPSPSNATTAPSTQAPAPEADTRVYATSDLPPNIQRDLPKLVVGGGMYSDTPANRMLIINSQVFHEGDKLAPELVLQEIKLKSAIFKYKGYRYGVSY